ncbi:MAG: TIGR02996 domain-containing protein [Polyangiales bacterium]
MTERAIESLFAEVYAHPLDDGPRMVLADALQERGDPRGEFIALQCQPEKTAESARREATLLRKHGAAWIGELEPAIRKQGREKVGRPVFRRGFLSAATVFVSAHEPVAASPAWATLEELWFWAGELLPAMRHVRVLHHPPEKSLLAEGPEWGVEELHVTIRELEVAEAYATSDRLPRLTRLHLEGPADWVQHARFAPNLAELTIRPQGRAGRGANAPVIPEFVTQAPARFPALEKLALRLTFLGERSAWLYESTLSLTKDERGAFTVGTLAHTGGEYAEEPFPEGIDSILSQISLTSLTVTSTSKAEPPLHAALVKSAQAHQVAKLDLTKVGGEIHAFAARAPAPAVPPKATDSRLDVVSQIAFAPDGSLFVGARAGIAALDPKTFAMRGYFTCEDRVQAVAACDRYVAASFYGSLRIFDRAGKRLHRMDLVPSNICAVAFSADQTRVAVGAENKMVVLVDTETGKASPPMKPHDSYVNDLAFSPDGKLLATVSLDDTGRILDVAKRRTLKKLLGHTRPVTGVLFSPDGARVITTSYDATVRAWSVATGLELASHVRQGGDGFKGSQAACFSADGTLVVAWNDGDVTFHDPTTLAVSRRMTVEKDLELEDVAVSPDGAFVVVAHDHGIVVLDAATGDRVI